MAFLRFTRDKRGYEHFYLVQPTTNRRGKVRTRILYWFRTPPNVKVGRQPFDDALRRALEAQNPGIAFDWQKIVETPIPSADAEKRRERRRAERAERVARQVETEAEEAEREAEEAGGEAPNAEDEPASSDQMGEAPPTEVPEVRVAQPDEQQRRRRRRRRGRHGRPDRAQEPQPAEPPTTLDAAPSPDIPESHEPQ